MNIIPHQVSGIVVPQQEENGYFNATALSKAHLQGGGKRRDVSHWLENKRTQESLNHLARSTGIPVDQLTMTIVDGPNETRGTYLHPKLATRFAVWLNDDIGYKVECWVEDWVKRGRAPQVSDRASDVIESVQIIDALSGWMTDANIDRKVVTMWKFDRLAKRHPQLQGEAEAAKKLIGGEAATENQYLTPTQLGDRVGIKARQMNTLLESAGLQFKITDSKGKSKWDLTEEGKKYGSVQLVNSSNTDWSGGQVKWLPTVLDVLGLNQQSA